LFFAWKCKNDDLHVIIDGQLTQIDDFDEIIDGIFIF
jgi:hypothetical protein